MNGVEGVLAGVLAEHALGGDTSQVNDAAGQCSCGTKFYVVGGTPRAYLGAHRALLAYHAAHVAAEQVKALREWAQQDETVEVGIYVFVNEGLIPEDMSYAEVVGTVLTAVFGSSA